ALRKKHAQRLAEFAAEEGLDGINLDYESMYAEDKDLFTDFVRLLSGFLKKEKLSLSAALHAKRSDGGLGPEDWHGPKSQDWGALEPFIDIFQPMCYDFHCSVTQAGPIAPPD